MSTFERDTKNERQPIVYTRRKKQDNKLNLEQDETYTGQGPSTMASDEIEPSSTATPLPHKHRLERLLDELQSDDPHHVLGRPVDPNEVPEYYAIIKEPIDYGTIRTKLHEDKYSTLEEFEKDVMLVTANAKTYNTTKEMYFRQARSIHLKAITEFKKLRKNEEEIENICSVEKKRPGRKPQAVSGSCSRSGSSSGRRRRNKDSGNEGTKEYIAGGESSDRRRTYIPPTSLFCENDRNPKQFQLVDTNIPYRESLKRFAEGMGPIVQEVVDKKLDPTSLAQAPCLVPGNEFMANQQTLPPLNTVRPESDEELQMTLMNSYGQYWQDRFRVDAFLQQQMSPSRPPVPLHGSMLGARNFNAGAYSFSPNQQSRATIAWNHEQQQKPSVSSTCLNLDLQLGAKPPSSDGH